MDDVASVHSENLNLRKIQQKLMQWEKKDDSLSPLTTYQLNSIEYLQDCERSTNEVDTTSLPI